MSINFQGSKRSEIAELEFELNHNKLERRIEAIKKVGIHSSIKQTFFRL